MLRSSTDLIDSSLFLPHKCCALFLFSIFLCSESRRLERKLSVENAAAAASPSEMRRRENQFLALNPNRLVNQLHESKEFNIFLSHVIVNKLIWNDYQGLSWLAFISTSDQAVLCGFLVFSISFFFYYEIESIWIFFLFRFSSPPASASVCAMKMKNL